MLLCPECGEDDNFVKASKVVDSPVTPTGIVKRRRICRKCQKRWWTLEIDIAEIATSKFDELRVASMLGKIGG